MYDPEIPAADYCAALARFRDLLEQEHLDAGLHDEYVRGGVNLLAELFGVAGLDASQRMDDIMSDLRCVPQFATDREVRDALAAGHN